MTYGEDQLMMRERHALRAEARRRAVLFVWRVYLVVLATVLGLAAGMMAYWLISR